jgi:hypothetical protein
MRAARAMPVGRPATKAASALSSERRTACGAVVGNRKARAPTEPAARPPSLGSASPAVAAPAGSGDPAQLPWASRSRASRCPSGGRSEICVPCGWQHSPSSEACSCQVRPSQHQPWLVSTCSVTAHPSHRFCCPSASTQRRATHTSPAARTGPRSTTTTAGLAPRLWDGTSCGSRGGGAEPTMGSFRVTNAAAPAGGPPLPTGSGAGWHVLDADVGEPGRNHNGVPVGAARVALGMIAVRPPGRPPHSGEAGGSRQCGRSR